MPSPKRKAAPLAPGEFGELAATEWFRQAAGHGGPLHDALRRAVQEVLRSGGLGLEFDQSGGADFPPAVPAAEPCAHAGANAVTDPTPAAATPDPLAGGMLEQSGGFLAEVTAVMLDAGEMYQCSGSVWNAAIMLGHRCLGLRVSLVLMLALLLNIAAQVAFCIIVWQYMLEQNMEDEDLDRLLSFRLGVAHHVDYADKVGQRSLARQVCEMDPRLHSSAMHTSFLENYETFHVGGPVLMLLAMFLWIALIFRELRQIAAQLHALGSVRRGPRTTVVLVGADPDAQPSGRHPTATRSSRSKDVHYLDKLTVTARLVELTKVRVLGVCVGVVLPRLVVAGLLLVCGVRYLGKTEKMEDLVLNAMALSFVLGIDEEFFETFLPRRVQTLIYNLEAIPLNGSRRIRRFPTIEALVVFISILVGLVAAHAYVMQPFISKLEQSRDILCSGQLDFVFSQNSASGMIHVARSAKEAPLTPTERVMLQVAQPLLRSDEYWNVDVSLVALAQAGQPPVAFEVEPQLGQTSADSLDVLHFHEGSFQKVADIGEYALEEAAGTLPCSDEVVERYPEVLSEIAGDSNITSCFDMDVGLCGKMDSTRLRALCPITCQCWPGVLTWSGPFARPAFGCPTECSKFPTRFFDALVGNIGLEGSTFPCEDTGTGNFSTINEYLPPWYQLWALFVPTVTFREFYLTYVSGLREYVTKDAAMIEGVSTFLRTVDVYFPFIAWPDYDALVEHIVGGGFFDELAAGTWTVFPGIPHPRGLTGCDYLASAEITFLLSLDLCAVGKISSIRPWCPRVCGCSRGMPECPSTCE